MTIQTRPCPSCRAATEPQVIPSMRGAEEPLQVVVHDMTVQACAAGHVHFVSIDFPLKLLERLHRDEAGLPHGQEKGLIFKSFHCEECRQELAPKPDHRHTFELEVALDEVPAFRVGLVMPVYRCPGCGRQQLHSLDDVRAHTLQALARAFESGGIAREG